ncbi:HD domain-containing phosphohydrolase [Mariprofundus sp. EBB-1]|uniref:HD domain-containing phosphohydrolase n=1 Tax=Mariprofundus sp. EBB-1 TaxID=2650971 RepID=UPI00137B7CE4|nr:HD domain-containing phosphohydrolase [Mariprofundus sp. EBB-1]
MSEKILFVDDDINILQAYKRQLRKQFDLHTAQGPEEALKLIADHHNFAVVVSDFSMPGMNGVEFLSEVKKISPNSVRIMLTGFANATNAINAVNEGNIFRFLAKPCAPEQLALSLHASIDQYHLITAEKELLEKTLSGSIKVMSQILSLVNPVAFSSTSRIKSYIKHMVETLNLPGKWRYELAAMLCELGYVTLPPETTSKILANQPLSSNEQTLFDAHPTVSASMLDHIPRLEEVAEMVRRQQSNFSDYTLTEESILADPSTLGGCMLKVALDFDRLINTGMSLPKAIQSMSNRRGVYYPRLLQCMESLSKVDRSMEIRPIYMKDLTVGMIADEDILTVNHMLLIAKGQEVNLPMLERLRSFAKTTHIIEPCRMRIP